MDNDEEGRWLLYMSGIAGRVPDELVHDEPSFINREEKKDQGTEEHAENHSD